MLHNIQCTRRNRQQIRIIVFVTFLAFRAVAFFRQTVISENRYRMDNKIYIRVSMKSSIPHTKTL